VRHNEKRAIPSSNKTIKMGPGVDALLASLSHQTGIPQGRLLEYAMLDYARTRWEREATKFLQELAPESSEGLDLRDLMEAADKAHKRS